MGKWLRRVAVSMVVLAAAFGAFVWIGSEFVLRKSYSGIPAVAPPCPAM
jgi:hypothetical protein